MRRTLIAAVTLVTALSVVLPASAAQPAATGRDRAAQAHADVVAFWTPERIAAAVPRDVNLPTPMAKPQKPGPGGGGTGSTDVVGDPWASPLRDSSSMYATVGKVLFALGSNYYVCSASLVNQSGAREPVVATAAHCVYDEQAGEFVSFWTFIPDYDAGGDLLSCNGTAYGCWSADVFAATEEYALSGGTDLSRDVAFVRLNPGGLNGTTDITTAITASHGLDFSGTTTGTTAAIGYPAGSPYPGNDLTYCMGPLTRDPYGQPTIGLGCQMTGGSSGGPWMQGIEPGVDEVGELVGVTSYGYTRGRYAGKYLYSSVFDASIGAMYQALLTANASFLG